MSKDVRFWRLKTSDSDVFRRQILTSEDGPCIEIIKKIMMAEDA